MGIDTVVVASVDQVAVDLIAVDLELARDLAVQVVQLDMGQDFDPTMGMVIALETYLPAEDDEENLTFSSMFKQILFVLSLNNMLERFSQIGSA